MINRFNLNEGEGKALPFNPTHTYVPLQKIKVLFIDNELSTSLVRDHFHQERIDELHRTFTATDLALV
jgi:hypothetical protein